MTLLRLRWPELGCAVSCRVLEHAVPTIDSIARSLPASVVQSHAVVSGALMYMLNVPLNYPVEYGRPLRRESLATAPVGRVWTTSVHRQGQFQVKYGTVSEDIPYPPIAQVIEDDIATLKEVGREVLASVFRSKRVYRVELSAESND